MKPLELDLPVSYRPNLFVVGDLGVGRGRSLCFAKRLAIFEICPAIDRS
jgi:hypothetical protein